VKQLCNSRHSDYSNQISLSQDHLQQFPNNRFPITGIGDVPIAVLGLLGELLLQSPNNLVPIQQHIGKALALLYLRGVGVKYWDNLIVIGEREMYWRTAGAHPSFSQ